MDSSIDWHLWKHRPEVKLWQAVCLAQNINPSEASSKLRARPGMMGIHIIEDIFTGDAQGKKLLLLLKENLLKKPEFFTAGTSVSDDSSAHNCVRLTEFAAWCAHIDYEIPPELAALAKSGTQATQKNESEPVKQSAPSTNVEAVTVTTSIPGRRVNKLRTNTLDPAIEKAIQQAGCATLAPVYLKLKELALSSESPFTGEIAGDALCYTNDKNDPDKLTKNALSKRLKRR